MGQGFTNRGAIKKQAAFITALAVTDVLTYTSENLKRQRPPFKPEYLNATSGQKVPRFPIESVAGDIVGEAVIDEITTDPVGWEHIIMGALGVGTWDAVNSLTLYTVSDNLPNFTTAFLKRSAIVWENIGTMINNLSLAGSASDQKLMWTATCLAYKQLMSGDAGIVNTSATFTGLTPPARPAQMLFSDMVIRLADCGDALAAADQINVSEFNLTINNNLEDPVHATPDNTVHTDSEYPMEFLRNGLREVTLNLTLPRYTAETFFQAHKAGTLLQADLVITVGAYNHAIYLPCLKVLEPAADVGGAEIFPNTLNMQAFYNYGADGDNAYMLTTDGTEVTGEIAWEAKSKRTGAPA